MNSPLKTVPERRVLIRRRRAAEMLDTSVSMMKDLEKAGRLKPVRVGRRDVFYRAEEVEALTGANKGRLDE